MNAISERSVRHGGRQHQVLEAAEKLARSGEPVTPTTIASAVGISKSHAGQVIATLKSRGEWPYGSLRPRVAGSSSINIETRAICEISRSLANLPPNAKRRVLDYVGATVAGEG